MLRTARNLSSNVSLKELTHTVRKWRRELNVLMILEDYCLANQTPFTLGVLLLCRSGDRDGLISLSLDPSRYHNGDGAKGWREFRTDYQALKMLSKFPFEGLRDTRQVAIDAWFEAEAVCAQTNEKFRNPHIKLKSSELDEVFHYAVRLCADCLGDFHPDEWLESCRFGPGVTSDSKDRLVYDKLVGPLGVTQDAKLLLDFAIRSSPAWFEARGGQYSTIDESGRQTFVPKNAKTDRSIETQPSGCLFLQAGLGSMIRSRLKKVGVNLNDQGKNQYLSRLGSKTGHLATIDIKSASDTLAYHLVMHMLPFDWFHALDICRTASVVRADGQIHILEKFSSMGNGYTFELESLIFWALSEAACRLRGKVKSVSIFGDDIICPTISAPLVMDILEECGFTINIAKSYLVSYFRESCGVDMFDGHDVRPFYIKEDIVDVSSHIRLANRILRYANRLGDNHHLDASYRSAWIRVVSHLPASIRKSLTGPYAEADNWLIQPQDHILSYSSCRRKYIEGTGRVQWFFPAIITSVIHRRENELIFETGKASLLYYLNRRSTVITDVRYSRDPSDCPDSSGEYRVPHKRVITRQKVRRIPHEWSASPSVWI